MTAPAASPITTKTDRIDCEQIARLPDLKRVSFFQMDIEGMKPPAVLRRCILRLRIEEKELII